MHLRWERVKNGPGQHKGEVHWLLLKKRYTIIAPSPCHEHLDGNGLCSLLSVSSLTCTSLKTLSTEETYKLTKKLCPGKNLLMSNRFQAAITGKPRSFHCGPEIQRMKLNNNKWTKQDKNPNWQETNQLTIYIPGPVSRKSRELFWPEKQVVKLKSTYCQKLIFWHVYNVRKSKRVAKLDGFEPRRCEDILYRNCGTRNRPENFGTFEKQASERDLNSGHQISSPTT